jgi:hypothetical protein
MRATVVKAPAGIGKTHVFAKRVAFSTRTTEVYVPTLRLAEEWRNSILRINPAKVVRIIRGRSVTRQTSIGHRSKATNLPRPTFSITLCKRHVAAEALSKAGLPVYPNLCKRSQGPGSPPVKCAHYDHCDYLAQFQTADVYIYTHAHLPVERGRAETWLAREVIIDESPLMGLIETVKMPFALLTDPRIPAVAKSLCSDVAAALQTRQPLQPRFAAAAGHRGELAAALAALAATPALSPSDTDAQQQATLRQSLNLRPIRLLLSQLEAETAIRPDPQSALYAAATGEIVLHHRKKITRFDRTDGTQPEIFILDACASRRITERFFEIESFVPMAVDRNARVVQCHSTRCSTTSMVPAKNGDATSRTDAARRLGEVTDLIERMAADGKQVLVIGPVAVVGNPSKGTPALITVPSHCELAHFNALKGIDHWKEFDVVIVIGRNEPPVAVFEDIARAIFFDDPQALNLTGTWTTEVRGYSTTGAASGVDVAVHADPRVQEVVEQVRECESLQAIDRIRLMHCAREKTVILLSNLPLDLVVHEFRTWDELMHGLRIERAWTAADGILPLSPEWLATNHPELWSTPGAAKADVARARKKEHFPNSISLRKMSLFEVDYKPLGQRQWSRCIVDTDDLALVEQRLSALLAQPIDVRP